MKLEEQFGNIILNDTHNTKCAELADNHAIGFNDWYKKLSIKARSGNSTKQLLEIYKETL